MRAEDDTRQAQFPALDRVALRWDESRTERVLAAARRQLRARRVLRGGVAGAVVVAIAIVTVLLVSGVPGPKQPVATVAPAPSVAATASADPRRIHFQDGSRVELLGERSEIEVLRVSDAEVDVKLQRGRGRFSVVPRAERAFRVRAGAVTVVVVGTEFEVELRGDRTWVGVRRGSVQVTWAGGEVRLESGGEGVFPLPGTRAEPGPASSVRVGAVVDPPADEFRRQAEAGRYTEAYGLLSRQPEVVGAGAADLMLAADVARLSGHPGAAVGYLQRVLGEHPGASQAPLAAFTLGRVLMGLGRHAQAAQAFARVTALAPGSPLAEDALARQVEAAASAGDRAQARRLARRYLAAYPSGRRKAAVRRQAGLESDE